MTCPRPDEDACTDQTPCDGCKAEAACFFDDSFTPGTFSWAWMRCMEQHAATLVSGPCDACVAAAVAIRASDQ